MNTLLPKLLPRKNLIAIGVACALLAACAASPTKPDGAENLRSRLTQLRSDPRLGDKAPLAMKEADEAVTNAERPQTDKAIAAHLVFLADRKIDTAQAQAEGNYAVSQRTALNEEREAMRLQARTREADAANMRAAVAHVDANNQLQAADLARSQALTARADANDQRLAADAARGDANDQRLAANAARGDADVARNDANVARDATANAQRDTAELQKQINELHARVTDRGLVLTLGDVLFASGTARLNRGGNSHLAKLAAFLNKYPERNALIEGYTDSVGGEDYNQGLSERRADAVKSFLADNGIDATRLTTSGKGEQSPVGNNATATGRQQNRRVEVIITNNLVAAR
jgi:outer membrane protein OmpA-like peptidoglycan-associated protein